MQIRMGQIQSVQTNLINAFNLGNPRFDVIEDSTYFIRCMVGKDIFCQFFECFVRYNYMILQDLLVKQLPDCM